MSNHAQSTPIWIHSCDVQSMHLLCIKSTTCIWQMCIKSRKCMFYCGWFLYFYMHMKDINEVIIRTDSLVPNFDYWFFLVWSVACCHIIPSNNLIGWLGVSLTQDDYQACECIIRKSTGLLQISFVRGNITIMVTRSQGSSGTFVYF